MAMSAWRDATLEDTTSELIPDSRVSKSRSHAASRMARLICCTCGSGYADSAKSGCEMRDPKNTR